MDETKIVCAWCNVPLSDSGIEAYNGAAGCDSCGPDAAEVEIRCTNKDCPKYNQVIYAK